MKIAHFLASVLAALPLLASTRAIAADTGRIEKRGWFLGLPVQLEVILPRSHGGPAPDAPTDSHPDIVIYLTAPTSDAAATAAVTISTGRGPRVLPPHDDVITRMTDRGRAADALGYFVVPGPKADEYTVRAQASPENSLPGAPLAREIFVGTDWVRLTSHAIIDYGIAMDWLRLVEFGYGGQVRTHFVDASVQWSAESKTEPGVPLPHDPESP